MSAITINTGPLPACIPVRWTERNSNVHYLAYPRMTQRPWRYKVIGICRGTGGDFADHYEAVVDDFGDLIPVRATPRDWLNTIGQRGH